MYLRESSGCDESPNKFYSFAFKATPLSICTEFSTQFHIYYTKSFLYSGIRQKHCILCHAIIIFDKIGRKLKKKNPFTYRRCSIHRGTSEREKKGGREREREREKVVRNYRFFAFCLRMRFSSTNILE